MTRLVSKPLNSAYQGACDPRSHQRVLPLPDLSRGDRWEAWELEVDAGRIPWLTRAPRYMIEYRHPSTKHPWSVMAKAWRPVMAPWWWKMLRDPPDVLENRALASTWLERKRFATRQEARDLLALLNVEPKVEASMVDYG